MITLTYYSDTQLDINATVTEQWREYVTQRQELVLNADAKWRIDIQVQPDDSSYRYRALMQKPQLVLKFSLPFYLEFPVGAWCEFQNQRFILTRAQDLKKQGTRKIEYTMTLGTNEDYFGVWKIRNVVDTVKTGAPKDNRLKFSMCAKPHEFIDLIVRNLNKKDTSVTWERGECLEAAEKTVEFNHTFIDAGLADICNVFQTEYEVEYIGMTRARLHLRRVEYFKTEPVALSYGCGNGFIPGVGRTSEADGVPVKRMLVQGCDRNIDRAKYGSPELLLPKSQTIRYDGTHFEGEDGFNAAIARTYQSNADGDGVERIDIVSEAVKEDSIDCSEIYPSRVGVASEVICTNKDKHFYDIVDNTIPANLNYNNYLIAGETMTIIFQDGMLAGKEFDVKYIHDTKAVNGTNKSGRRFEIVPQEIDGILMPDETFCPVVGQKYAIFGIQLPDEYICNNTDKSGGSWDMMRAAVKALYECEDQRFTFTGSLQALWAKRHWLDVGGKLIVGGHVLFQDEQFAKTGVVIRIVGIKDYLTQPYSPTIELSNSVSGGSSVSSQIRQITNTEVVIEETKKSVIQYTKRRFRDALETIGLLEDANIGDFTGGISPVAVQTMALLAGDESLQFRFVYRVETKNEDGTTKVSFAPAHPIGYDNDKKQLFANMESGGMKICLQHMTLEQRAIMTQERRDENGYLTWEMQSFTSPVLNEPSRTYYFYAKVHRTDTKQLGEFVLSEKAIAMEQVENYYHLLCGVLNSEIEGARSYVSMYGFTEVLPGRVTTDLIISNDGKTYFDLESGEIGGAIKFLSDSGYITIIEGGKIKTELIDVSQIIARSVIVGEPDKQRVEIQPDISGNGSVKIFDEDNNECTVFEGESYNDIKELYDGSTGGECEILPRKDTFAGYQSGITLGRGKASINASELLYDKITEQSRCISKVWHTGTPTEVSMRLGTMSAYAYSTGYTETRNPNEDRPASQKNKQSYAYANVYIQIETYKEYDEATDTVSNLIDTAVIVSAYASACASAKVPTVSGGNNRNIDSIDRPTTGGTLTYQYPNDTNSTGNIDIANRRVRVPAGYHRIVVYYYLRCSMNGSKASIAWGDTTGSLYDLAAKWISDFYVSRYFANGFCLGTRSDNYILAYKSADGMRFVMENNDLGFDFSKSGVRTRVKGKNWMPLPMLIYKAAYNYDGSNSTYTIDSSQGTRSFNDDNMPATRTAKGLVTLSFPDSWKTALSDIGVKNLLVQINALHKVIDCRVEQITTSEIKVAMSDDSTVNDGNFNIVIYYLVS